MTSFNIRKLFMLISILNWKFCFFFEEYFFIHAFLKVVALHLWIEKGYHQHRFSFLSSLCFHWTLKSFEFTLVFHATTFFKFWFYTAHLYQQHLDYFLIPECFYFYWNLWLNLDVDFSDKSSSANIVFK